MDDYLKTQCINLVIDYDYRSLNEWIQAHKYHIIVKIMSDYYTSIVEVHKALEEYD